MLLLLVSLSATSQSTVDELDSVLHLVVEKQAFNGSVLIAQGGEIVYCGHFGLADPNTDRRLGDQTIFRLASMSKQFTALGVALLAAEGELDLDDPVARYLPELSFYDGVTLRHLIYHYGGLPDYLALVAERGDAGTVYDNEAVISLLAQIKPEAEFVAGTKSAYSNTGYLLLASVIERVSGQHYADFLRERIFAPLKMARTYVPYPQALPDTDVAVGFITEGDELYVLDGHERDPYGYWWTAGVVGDGMVFSTLDDLYAYDRGMRTDGLLPEQQRRLLYQPGALEKNDSTGYAFGQIVGHDDFFGRVVEHNGSWAGFLNNMERHPDSNNLIVVLSNHESDYENINLVARQFLRGSTVELPKWLRSATVTAKQIKPYAGDYQITEKTAVRVMTKGNQLFIKVGKQPKYPMVPFSANGFYLEGTTTTIEFNHGPGETVDSMTFTQGDRVFNGPKTK